MDLLIQMVLGLLVLIGLSILQTVTSIWRVDLMTPEQELALIEQVNLHLERAWSLLYRLEKAKTKIR
jgi:hypothetical protein